MTGPVIPTCGGRGPEGRHLSPEVNLPPLHRPLVVWRFCTEDSTWCCPYPQKRKLELTSKTAATMAKAMKATKEKAATRTEAEIVCETVPSQRSSSAR